ncbi:hypothetical protein GCM10025771_29400 [Niveibacterium umoris]|uniref:Uncharacterized protein n=1 Tax=Niveibacterium umoris TaxID=1193620 RepID=A0A840BN07_9RHOO|nr:hypothetical protein [Niveibacterium umoris]MBB4011867.1 hypothetical protein [Niveibacterium umoris]
MRPTIANLLAANHGTLTISNLRHNNRSAGLAECKSTVALGGAGNAITLDGSGGGDEPGMWVHYLETRAAYGIASGGETWAASGPFSGCHIAIGKCDQGVYLAHIAQQSGSNADEQWRGRALRNEVTWGRWKVPVPSFDFFSNSVVFVDWSRGNSPAAISVVRVDLRTVRMGGFDDGAMEIFNVVHLVNPDG